MEAPYKASNDVWVLRSYEPAPGMGLLPINAFLIKSEQPALIDTGIFSETQGFMEQLGSLIDPAELRWIVLTHEEGDHTGALDELIKLAPNAKIVLNWLAMAKMGGPLRLPMPRLHLMNPGQSIDLGDRSLFSLRPPVFDSPSTLSYFEPKESIYFSADSFGGLLPHPAENLTDMDEETFSQGFGIFNRANSPWIRMMDRQKFASSLDEVVKLDARLILSAHAPVAAGKAQWLADKMLEVAAMPEFVGPDQAALEQMLAQMAAGTPV